MRRRLGLLLAALAALAVSAPAQAADYVGLGDSYSSGTGTAGSYEDNCQRTNAAYPMLIRASLGAASGINLSCSGGRTQHITTDAQTPGNPDAQLDLPGIDAGTEWVTLQIGGNDAGFVDTLVECGNPFGNCGQAIEDAEEIAENELPPKLNTTYDAVRAEAPNATIAVVGYPRIFRPNASCNTFFSADEVNDLNAAADKLDQLTRQIAHENDLAYVDVRPAFLSHGACDSVEWINGLDLNDIPNSYHPKVNGHSNGFAPTVIAGLLNVPITSITGSPGSPSNSANPQFQFSSDVAGSTFQCKLDAGAFTACTSPRVYTGVGEGSHTFQVRAINPSGDVDQLRDAQDSYTWTVDTIPPSLTLDPGGPSGTVTSNTAAFTFAGGGTLTCRLDTGAFQDCTTPTSQSYSGLADGAHTFTVRATDAAGNVATATRLWTQDTTAPVATVNSGPADPTPAGGATLDFTLNDPSASAECRLIGPLTPTPMFGACTSPKQYTGLTDGEYRFEVKGTDLAGNPGSIAGFEWAVDSTASAVSISDGPDALTNQDGAAFSFASEDPEAELECKLDGGGFSDCESGSKSYADLGEGTHTFTVQATDNASNVATDTWIWTIDVTDPPIALDSGPQGTVTSSAAQFVFSSIDLSAGFECRENSTSPSGFVPCDSPRVFNAPDDGPYTFDVRAVDPAGNVSDHVSRAWTVDTSEPTATITGQPAALSNNDSPTFTVSLDEAGADLFCRIDSSLAVEFEPCGSPKTYAELDDGSHSFDVRAVDDAGNVGPIDEFDWTIDTLAPTAVIDDKPPILSSVDSANFTFHADQGGSFQCRLDGDAPNGTGFVACGSGMTGSRNYAGNAIDEGAHLFEVRSVDAAGNTGPAAIYEWTSDSVAPTVSIQGGPPNGSLSNQTATTFGFSASESAAMECKLDTGSFVACTTATSASYDVGQGSHTFTVKATDAAGHASSPVSRIWTVDSIPPVVEITSGPDGLTNQTLASFGFTSSGGGAPECKLDSGSFTACDGSPKVYSGLSDGPHTITVRSTDLALNATSATRSWTVDATRPQTTIDSGPASPTASTEAEFEFSSSEAGTLQCSLDGAVFATCTSPVSHTGLAQGDHSFRVRAIDAAGNVDSSPAVYAWRVTTEPPASSGVAGTTKAKPKCKRTKKRKRCKKKRKS